MPCYTSTTGINIELDRFSIGVNVESLILNYWKRLICLPKSTLVSHCYWSLLDNPHPADLCLHFTEDTIFFCNRTISHLAHKKRFFSFSSQIPIQAIYLPEGQPKRSVFPKIILKFTSTKCTS